MYREPVNIYIYDIYWFSIYLISIDGQYYYCSIEHTGHSSAQIESAQPSQ